MITYKSVGSKNKGTSQVSLVVKNLPANAGGMRQGFDPWVGKTPWRRKWQPTPVFLPGKSLDRGAWQTTVHEVAKSWTPTERLSTEQHRKIY